MKRSVVPALFALLIAPAAFAGGPVVVMEEAEVVAEEPASSAGLLPFLLIPVILCVAFCGTDDEEEPAQTALPPP